MSTNYF